MSTATATVPLSERHVVVVRYDGFARAIRRPGFAGLRAHDLVVDLRGLDPLSTHRLGHFLDHDVAAKLEFLDDAAAIGASVVERGEFAR